MSRWTIYDKDGNALHESIVEYDGKGKVVYQDTFEYVGKWMGECYLTVSIKSPYPIDFQIGDYIEYRGEKFTINYDPTVIKKARRGTYGEGFVYDSIKFNSYSNELTMMLFHDWVLDDNKVHYTSLPAFSFYAKDVDDLADRLQACADRWCKDNGRDKSEYWMFYTLANNTQGTKDTGQYQTTYERTVQRAKDISTDSAFLSAVQSEWVKTYGNPSDYKDSRDDERYDRNISISNNTVWDGLQKVKTEFGLNFIIRGRNVYIGTVGVPTSHLFEYGKGKGLYEVDKTADTDQKVVTRLHAYGSDQNMPTRYYAEVTSEAFSTIKEIKENPTDYSFARFTLDLPYSSRYFTNAMTKYGSNVYAVGIKVGDILVNARVEGTDNNGNVEIYSECLQSSKDDDDNTDFANFGQFKSAIAVGARIFFTKGVDRSAFPISNIGFEDGVKALPDNMAVNSLMLPGFPLYSLADICKSVYDSASNSTNYYIKKKPSGTDDEYVLFHTESGKHVVSFSNDRHDPYIVSQNAASLGYRDGDISCTESNDDNGLEAVYPSIEKVTVSDAGIGSGDARVDVIDSADTIDDNGVYDKEGVSVPSFHVTLPKLGFDLRQAAKDANNSGEFKLSMKDGFCGGREFTAKVESVDASTGKITLRVQRSYDDSLFLWFPYSYAKSVQAVGPGMTNAYQILPGDHFVLTGINVGDVNYVWTASVRLLRKAIHWLCKNDYTRYVYTPKIDEIFMARQDLEAKSDTSGKTASIHDTLKEGDVLLFDDDDLLINGSVYIDQLTIKENGNNGIPTYDVTLRNEVNVGTLQRIQNKVDSVANDIRTGNIGGNVGMTPSQVDPLVKAYGAKYFLSKTQDDTAQGLITFAKGLISDMLAKLNGGATFGTDGYKFDEKGNVVVDALSSRGFDEALERGFGLTKNSRGKYTLSVTDLMVWGKAVFNSLEIRKLYAVGGNVYLSGASSKIVRAMPVKKATDTGTTENGDASETWVACAEGDADCEGWKCYTLNDDGTTATQNGWRKYDQAKCQTFDIEAGAHEGVSNTFYWRLVADVSTKNETITETRTETYVDDDGVTKTREVTVDLYDGKKFGWVVLSKTDCESTTNDAPKAGDTIVLDGHRMFASGDAEGRDQYNDESRTNVMMLETTGTENGTLPRIVALTGIVDYRHWDVVNPYSNTVFILSPKEVVFVSSSFKFMSASGDPITLVNFRGNWAEGTEYRYYDQVSHGNAIWTCIVKKGDTTTAEPSDTSTDWRKEISGGNGIDHVETRFFAWKSDTFGTGFDSDRVWEDGSTTMPADFSDDFPWLWQVTRTYYTNGTDVLGEAVCIGYKGKDAVTYGVQVTPYLDWLSSEQTDPGILIQFTRTTGATVETFTNVTKLGGSVMVYVDGVYHVDATKWINNGNDKIVFSHFPIDNTSTDKTLGTASTIGIELLVNSSVVATASYANGKQGADGKGALEILCDPETIVLDTDDNGLVNDTSNARAALMCVRDGKVVDGVTYEINKTDKNSTVNCDATVNNNGIVTITSVTSQSVTIGGNTVTVSSTSGSVTVSVTEDATGVTYTKTVPFAVNVARYTGGLKADNKKLQSQYLELTNQGTVTNLKEYKSEILQTAKEISLKVSEKSVGRRNLLPGSALRKQDEGVELNLYGNTSNGEGIVVNDGIDGVNALKVTTKSTNQFTGLFWRANASKSQQVKIKRNTKYTASVWVKCSNTNCSVQIECIYHASANDKNRISQVFRTVNYPTLKAGEWQLFTAVFSTGADYDYMECNFWATSASGTTVLFCKPMLEEGEEYNGWTLSEQDYDYVGGNLLDGTGTLTKTGNVEVLDETTVTQGGYNNESASVIATLPPTTANGDFLSYSTKDMGLNVGEDCMLSFYARAASDYAHGELQCYLYSPSTGSVMTESSHEKLDFLYNPGDGDLYTHITPTTAWKRYWVHWRPMGNVPKHILFRLLRPGADKGSYNPSTSYNVGDVVQYGGTYYVCQKAGSGYEPGASSYWEATVFAIEIARPKLEVGATMTEWTEKRADMVDKRALFATGIDIKSHKITATTDNFEIRNNSGTLTFSIDEDGNIVGVGNASFKGSVTAKTFTLSSDKFYVDNNGKFKLSMNNFSVKEDGTITAKGGSVSFFNFDSAGMYSGSIEQDGKIYSGLGMSMNNLSVSGNDNRRISSVFLGNGTIDSRFTNSDNRTVYRVGSTIEGSTFYNYIKLERIGSGSFSFENSPEHAALGIETQGDFCLAALGGPSYFEGLCFPSASGSSSMTADGNRTMYLFSGGDFYMPSNPPDGLEIKVIQTGSKITFHDGGHKFRNGLSYSDTLTSDTRGQWNFFYFDGFNWHWNYMNK